MVATVCFLRPRVEQLPRTPRSPAHSIKLQRASGAESVRYFLTVFSTVFLAAGFFVAGLLPALLVALASWLFLRATLFLCSKPFLAALSRALWALLSKALASFLPPATALWKALRALLRPRLVLLLRTAALVAVLTRFLADLMMGIY